MQHAGLQPACYWAIYMVRGLVQKSFLRVAIFCFSIALHIVFFIIVIGKATSNAPSAVRPSIVVANLDLPKASFDFDSPFENLESDVVVTDSKSLIDADSVKALADKPRIPPRLGGSDFPLDSDPNKIYYYPVKDLTQKPVLPEEMTPDLVLVPNKDFPQPLIVSLLINERGEIDQLVFPPKLPEAVQQQINTVFAQLKFVPGSIAGVLVKSRLDVQIMVETDLLPVNR